MLWYPPWVGVGSGTIYSLPAAGSSAAALRVGKSRVGQGLQPAGYLQLCSSSQGREGLGRAGFTACWLLAAL